MKSCAAKRHGFAAPSSLRGGDTPGHLSNWATLGPLGIGRLVEVSTEGEIDLGSVLAALGA
jgi:hypothetical protein